MISDHFESSIGEGFSGISLVQFRRNSRTMCTATNSNVIVKIVNSSVSVSVIAVEYME